MSYRDNKEKQFVFGRKRDVQEERETRHRSFARDTGDDYDDYEEEPVRPRRKTLREREMEEEEEEERTSRFRRRAPRKEEEYYDDDDDDYYDEYEEKKKHKAPMAVRIFAWIAGLAILFAAGYLATTFFFSWTDKKGGERIGSVYGSGEEVKTAEKTQNDETSETKNYTLCTLNGSEMTKRKVQLKITVPQEQNMKKIFEMQLDSLKEAKLLEPEAAVNEIYSNGECLYADMTPQFVSSLKTDGEAKRVQCLGAITTAMRDNFSEVKKIKFYSNGKEITAESAGVDLTSPWEQTL